MQKIGFKKFIFPILLLVIVVVVSLKFSEFKIMLKLFREAKWWWVILALGAIFLNYVSMSLTYRYLLNILDYPFRLARLIKSTVVILFLNQAVPSLSFAGNIFFLNLLRKHKIQEGYGMMVITLEFICYYIDFILIIFFALSYLAFRGSVTHLEIVALLIFSGILVFVIAMLRFWLLSKKNAKRRLRWLLEKFNYFGNEDWQKEDLAEHFVEEFRESAQIVKKKKLQILVPLTFQLGKFLFDALAIYFIFLAFNFHLNPVAVLSGYIISRLFGVVSFLPGGIGAVEGGLVLTYTSLGAPLEVAFAVSMIFRFFSFWLPLPIGVFIYRHLDGIKIK